MFVTILAVTKAVDKFCVAGRYVEGEREFLNTVNDMRRSLCLIQVNTVSPRVNYWDGKPKLKMTFTGNFDVSNPLTNNSDYPVKDCKWSGLMIEGYRVLRFQAIYLCVGLATPTPYDGVEYPQVIGLHTVPDTLCTAHYPD